MPINYELLAISSCNICMMPFSIFSTFFFHQSTIFQEFLVESTITFSNESSFWTLKFNEFSKNAEKIGVNLEVFKRMLIFLKRVWDYEERNTTKRCDNAPIVDLFGTENAENVHQSSVFRLGDLHVFKQLSHTPSESDFWLLAIAMVRCFLKIFFPVLRIQEISASFIYQL